MECVARDAGVDLNGSRSAASADRELASATRLSNQSMSSCSWTIVPRAPRRSRFKFVTLASAGHGPRAHFRSEPYACSITQDQARAEASERAAQLQLLSSCRLEMRPLCPSVQPASRHAIRRFVVAAAALRRRALSQRGHAVDRWRTVAPHRHAGRHAMDGRQAAGAGEAERRGADAAAAAAFESPAAAAALTRVSPLTPLTLHVITCAVPLLR